jgi:hypothetical protein
MNNLTLYQHQLVILLKNQHALQKPEALTTSVQPDVKKHI